MKNYISPMIIGIIIGVIFTLLSLIMKCNNALYYPVAFIIEQIIKKFSLPREAALPLIIPLCLAYAGFIGGLIGIILCWIKHFFADAEKRNPSL